MKTIGKLLALLSVGAMTATVPLSSTMAQDVVLFNEDGMGIYPDRGNYQTYQPRVHFRHYRGGNHHHGRSFRHGGPNNNDIAIGLGIAAGAIALGAIINSNSVRHVAPPPPVYRASGLQPWSPSWYRYCDRKYRSFNANTGTYRGYDGQDHFCVAN